MRRTLYGLAKLSVWPDIGPDIRKVAPCYYYYRNTFYACPWLDATVLWSDKRWALCVNEFSEHVAALRESSLYRLFAESGGLQDPQVLEDEEGVFVIRGDVDRTNERAKSAYLRKKYGCRTSVMIDSAFAGIISVADSNEGK